VSENRELRRVFGLKRTAAAGGWNKYNSNDELNEEGMGGDRFCGLVVRVLGYRYGGPGSIPCTTRKKSSGSGTGSTQPREYN
jgi:hypothetical protein